jgi:hypothetical protein
MRCVAHFLCDLEERWRVFRWRDVGGPVAIRARGGRREHGFSRGRGHYFSNTTEKKPLLLQLKANKTSRLCMAIFPWFLGMRMIWP